MIYEIINAIIIIVILFPILNVLSRTLQLNARQIAVALRMLMATADQNDQKVIRRCGHSPVGFGLTFCRKEREFSTSETCI